MWLYWIHQKSVPVGAVSRKISAEAAPLSADFWPRNISIWALSRTESALFRDFHVKINPESELKHFWIRADQRFSEIFTLLTALNQDWKISESELISAVQRFSHYEQPSIRTETFLNQNWSALMCLSHQPGNSYTNCSHIITITYTELPLQYGTVSNLLDIGEGTHVLL